MIEANRFWPLERLGGLCWQARLAMVCAALIGSPLALGGRADWYVPALALVNALGYALLFIEMACTGRRFRMHRGWWFAGGLVLLAGVQLLPHGGLTGWFSPEAAAIWQRASAAGVSDLGPRLSLAPARTALAIWLLFHLAVFSLLVYNTFTRRRHLPILTGCVVAAALANALAALLPGLLDIPHLYAALGIGDTPLRGTFLNRNHFAFLLGLGLVQLTGLALSVHLTGAGGQMSGAEEVDGSRGGRRKASFLVVLSLVAVPLAMAMLFSLSRGGAIAAGVGLLAFLGFVARERKNQRRFGFLLAAGALLSVLLVGSIEALNRLYDRYEELFLLGDLGLDGRWNVWRETLSLIGRFPLTGVGLHAFEPTSPMVESGFAAGYVSFHAHNDYLELLAEVGLPLGLAVLLLVGYALSRLAGRLLACREAGCRVLGMAGICGLVVALVHSLVEYSLRAPANGLLVATLATLCLLAGEIGEAVAGGGAGGGGRRQTDKSFQGMPSSWLRGLAAGLAAIVLLTAAAFLPRRIQSGREAMRLRAVVESGQRHDNRGAARKAQARYLIGASERILGVWPRHERALYWRALYGQILATAMSEPLAEREISAGERQRVADAVLASREAARHLCRHLPTQGYYQALYGKQLNLSAWYDETVAIPDIIRVFELAHANYPNVPQVTWLCLQAFAEIIQFDGDELTAAEISHVEALVVDLGFRLLDQAPARSREVIPILDRVLSDARRLFELTPRRLRCQEALYETLFNLGEYALCEEVLQAMQRINRERVTRDQPKQVSLYEFVRSHPSSRIEMEVGIVRQRLALAGAVGDWGGYAELREQLHVARQAACQEELFIAEQAAAAGQWHQALRLGRRVAARFADLGAARPPLAEWLATAGEYAEALTTLQALAWLEDVHPEIFRQALATSGQLAADRRHRARAELLGDILTVRLMAEDEASRDPGRLGDALAALEKRVVGGHTEASAGVYDHLALFYAGRSAELLDQPETALRLYRQVLARCPQHRATWLRMMSLPEGLAGGDQAAIREVLATYDISVGDLAGDLLDIAPGVRLRHFASDHGAITPFDELVVTVVAEITGEASSVPPLSVEWVAADGSRFAVALPWFEAEDMGSTAVMRVGGLLLARHRLVPEQVALRQARIFPAGAAGVAIRGRGRDEGFVFRRPGFVMQR